MLLDGLAVSKLLRAEVKERVDRLVGLGIRPRLCVLVSTDNPAGVAYVRMKRKQAEAAGIDCEVIEVGPLTRQDEVIGRIFELNANANVHGVLVQHPMSGHIDESEALLALGPKKDVDGITPQSLGMLASGLPGFRCATPLGIMKLLDHYDVRLEGKRAVVVGRSVILGKPAALMLLERNATVTIAHSKTQDLPELCREADLLVAAVGRPEMFGARHIKPGAVVIDAGYNKVEGRSRDVGDVEFESVSKVAGAITAVPGGVGPMTVASLLSNVTDAAEASRHE